jgi:hypothetical protein
MHTLDFYLHRFSRRLRIRDCLNAVQHILWAFSLLAFSFQIIGRFVPVPHLILLSLAPFLCCLLAITIYSLLKPLPNLRAARRIDYELDLKQRLSTALALQESENAFHPSLVRAQEQDALSIARNISGIQILPLKWARLHLSTAAFLISLAIILAVAPNPMNNILAQREAIAQAAKEEAKHIENLSQDIGGSQELSPDERQQLERQLAELAQALRANPGDLEKALADLSRVEQALQQQLDPAQAARQANLNSLTSRLESLASLQNNPDRSQLENAAAALEEMAGQIGSMNQNQRQALADVLAQLAAQSAQAGDAPLSQALSDFSQVVRSGDLEAVKQASIAAQQAMDNTQAHLVDQAALEQALVQLQASRQALAQAGQAVARAGSGQSNPGQNPGQGAGQGQGQNPGQGNPAGGGGSRANTLPPGTSQGRAARPQGNAPDAQASDLQAQVYAPWQRSPGNGEESFVPGQDTGQGETQIRQGQNPLPGSTGPFLVPYYEVYSSYLNAANQAMQQSYVPSSLLDYVRAYFSQLEP